MRYPEPLGEEAWNELMRIIERGPTPEQKKMLEKADRIYESSCMQDHLCD
ncbi:MAG: hypothetical protein MPK62_00850 [Alphaproteobacteria bacterium]|nr:hypothetical protein [Alphaproteobacteria bacterium]MDA8029682.1 hypothetical protein [Alphaproteobacteria bacterium]